MILFRRFGNSRMNDSVTKYIGKMSFVDEPDYPYFKGVFDD
jgi:hypothetical protein